MKDPKGNELKVVLLQVMDKDEQGPITLRVRRDHERIDLADERHRTFMMVWAPANEVLGEMRLSDLYEDTEKLKALYAVREQERVDLDRQLRSFERDLEALQAENKAKTEALRVLQRERDPERLEAISKERAQKTTAKLEDDLLIANSELVTLRQQVTELRAAKKRLKEANERLKEGR